MSGVDGSQRLELDVAEKEVLGCPIMKRPLDGGGFMPIGRVLGYCSPRRIEGKVNPGRIVGKREARENGLYRPYPGPETTQNAKQY